MYNPIFEDDDKNGNLKQLRELIYIRSTKHNISELGSNIITFIKKFKLLIIIVYTYSSF